MLFYEKEKKQNEIINGVNIIYNNDKGCEDKELENMMELASAELKDDEGNEFYLNFDSYDDAMYAVCELANRGIEAKIGLAGPIMDLTVGRYIENTNEDQVGVYIVSKLEKTISLRKSKKRKN